MTTTRETPLMRHTARCMDGSEVELVNAKRYDELERELAAKDATIAELREALRLMVDPTIAYGSEAALQATRKARKLLAKQP